MKLLIVGLGSVGKRHLKNFGELGVSSFSLMDPQSSRLEEARALGLKVETFSSLDEKSVAGIDGAVVASRGSLNEAYYGRNVSPTDILIRHNASNVQAAKLVDDITKSATHKSAEM